MLLLIDLQCIRCEVVVRFMFLEYGMGFLLKRQKYESADEWNNFLQRMKCNSEELKLSDDSKEELRLWASYRGQTLTRTGTLSLSHV